MNIQQLYTKINSRNGMLTPELVDLKSRLVIEYNKQKFTGGVINPGYYSYLYPLLDYAIQVKIIDRYHITQEQYENNGKMIEIPIVDVQVTENEINKTYRLFLINS